MFKRIATIFLKAIESVPMNLPNIRFHNNLYFIVHYHSARAICYKASLSRSASGNFNNRAIWNHNRECPSFVDMDVIFRSVQTFNAIYIDGDFWLRIASTQLLANFIYVLIDRELCCMWCSVGSLWDQRNLFRIIVDSLEFITDFRWSCGRCCRLSRGGILVVYFKIPRSLIRPLRFSDPENVKIPYFRTPFTDQAKVI